MNKFYDINEIRNKMSFNFKATKKEEEKNFKIGDTVFTYDIFKDEFVKMEVTSIHINSAKEIMINGRFEQSDCFDTLKEAYQHKCNELTKDYHDEIRAFSDKYYQKEKELKQC